VSPDLKQGIDFHGFNLHGCYHLREFLLAAAHDVSIHSVDANHLRAMTLQKEMGNGRLSVLSPTARQGSGANMPATPAAYSKTFSALSVEAYVARKPKYFVWSMTVPLASVTTLAFMQFAYPIDYSERVPLTVTLLLTTAAYANVIKGSLPDLGYLTLQDKYLLACAGLLFLCAIETPLVMLATGGFRDKGFVFDETGTFSTENAWCVDARGRNCALDVYCLVALASLWAACNAYFVVRCWRAWHASRGFMSRKWLLDAQGKTDAVKELRHAEQTKQESRQHTLRVRKQPSSKKIQAQAHTPTADLMPLEA